MVFIDELNATELGIKIEGRNVGGLLYADDIVLLAENAEQLQRSLCLFQNWCNKWRLNVNLGKTKVIHFGRKVVKSQIFNLSSMITLSKKFKSINI